jgi:hypothetical protein
VKFDLKTCRLAQIWQQFIDVTDAITRLMGCGQSRLMNLEHEFIARKLPLAGGC